MMPYSYCPMCGGPLVVAVRGDAERQCCADDACGHIIWDNPTPVVAAIVEHEGRVVLARNVRWPEGMFGLVTGFLEKRETPAEAVVREVKEELDLDGAVRAFVGHYTFSRMNQIIMAYHVAAAGEIRLNEELAEIRHLPHDQVRYWPGGTGWAVRDWLRGLGYDPAEVDLPPQVRDYLAGDDAQRYE